MWDDTLGSDHYLVLTRIGALVPISWAFLFSNLENFIEIHESKMLCPNFDSIASYEIFIKGVNDAVTSACPAPKPPCSLRKDRLNSYSKNNALKKLSTSRDQRRELNTYLTQPGGIPSGNFVNPFVEHHLSLEFRELLKLSKADLLNLIWPLVPRSETWSTDFALLPTEIWACFVRGKVTAGFFLDLKGAFPSVIPQILVDDL